MMAKLNSLALLSLVSLILATSSFVTSDRIGSGESNLSAPSFASNETCPKPTETKPKSEAHRYFLKPCLLVNFAGYLEKDGHYYNLEGGQVDSNLSYCDSKLKNDETIVIDYKGCASIQMQIHQVGSSTCVKAISGWYSDKEHTFTNSSGNLFCVKESGHYYKCNSPQEIDVGHGQKLVLSDLAIEAYRTSNGTDLYQIPSECPLDAQPVSDLVRYGVGICLVALVSIVLIAYFIGRRRWSERSTYESV